MRHLSPAISPAEVREGESPSSAREVACAPRIMGEKISHDLVEIFFDGPEDPSILLSR